MNMRNYINITCILLVLFGRIDIFAQEEASKKTPRLEFSYLKRADGNKLLKTNLYLFENRITKPLTDAKIIYTIGSDSVRAEVLTNNEGIAYLNIDKDTKISVDSDDLMLFTSSFEGNDTLEALSESLQVKDATIQMFLEIIDSVRTAKAKLTTRTSGEETPLAGENINFYVPRMFSLLKVGEGTTDEEGFVSVEFPNDLPGNSDSSLIVIAKLEEHEVYANIEAKQISNWGIPIIHRIPESHRALWTEIAPLWMIITLTILLCGVWGHYIFVIIQLILVRIEGRKQKAQNLE
jgi:hypothetical protein